MNFEERFIQVRFLIGNLNSASCNVTWSVYFYILLRIKFPHDVKIRFTLSFLLCTFKALCEILRPRFH